MDEVDRVQPIKPFPVAVCAPCRRYAGGAETSYAGPDTFESGQCAECGGPLRELTYLRLLTRAWQAAGGRDMSHLGPAFAGAPPVLAIPKPRRMRLSWLMVALHTHLAVFQSNARVFIVPRSSRSRRS